MTIIESTSEEHQSTAAQLVDFCLPHAGNALRIAISGSPGVGKSTMIEALGTHITSLGLKLAVLAVDPTSDISQGSILGDKTRMEMLSKNEDAFIRPSPTSGTLGGVTQRTFEAIILCEAAGYDIIFIETVGVGQSETFAQKLSDIFLLLVAPGTGDELQGIKRGIVELADIIVINKAEEERKALSDASVKAYRNATHLAPPKASGYPIKVLPCSALKNIGINDLWNEIKAYQKHISENNYLEEKRSEQNLYWAKNSIEYAFKNMLTRNDLKSNLNKTLNEVQLGKLSPNKAAEKFMNALNIEVDDV